MEEEANIGGYDNNAVIDACGVNMFSEWLMQAGGLFMPHFVYGDKVPNLDGRLEICELQNGKYVPVRSFYVQIKSFERDYINRNKKNQLSQYKYLCDTKIFNIVKRNVIMDPALLVMIDVKKKRFFFKYISEDYCEELNIKSSINKMIYFNDDDEIVDRNEWYKILYSIHNKCTELKKRMKEALYTEMKDNTYESTDHVPVQIIEASEYYNSIMEKELWFIKRMYFPDVWKFGFAYEMKKNITSMGIYYIYRDKDDELLKSYEMDEDYPMKMIYMGKDEQDPMKMVKDNLVGYIKRFFSEIIDYTLCPDVVLEEFLYNILDKRIGFVPIAGEGKNKIYRYGTGTNILTEKDVKKIVGKGYKKSEIMPLVSQLLSNGKESFVRPFIEPQSYYIKKKTKNSERLAFIEDTYRMDQENMKEWLLNLESFFYRCKELFGDDCLPVFDVTTRYELFFDEKDYIYTKNGTSSNNYCCCAEEVYDDESFIINIHIVNSKRMPSIGNANDSNFLLHSYGLYSINGYSYIKLWRYMLEILFVNYINGEKELLSLSDYMSSR